jgi:hypothetical protein
MSTWEALRDALRSNGFTSSFLVKDYFTKPRFKNEREKSFHFLRNCHVAFFVVESDVGKGGVVCELEEYKREVYPKKGKSVFLFEKCSDLGNKLREDPSSLIIANLTDEKFHVRRFIHRSELPSLFISAAKQAFYDAYLNPFNLLDPPLERLRCQFCGKSESTYMCIERCRPNCKKYHICENCIKKCGKGADSLYVFPEPTSGIWQFYYS